MNWIVETILVHIMFLGSIFIIYFRSPVILNLEAHHDLSDAPAKRLVLIITDGLRAESFFKDKCKYIPHIKEIFLDQGMIGISHTRVPTESRPGHIALIAGLYEDPTAVTKGWQENPIDFDSVFNRSKKTYAWGSNDILSIFAKSDYNKKMEFFAYDHALDFSGKEKTYHLDTWVFQKARDYLEENGAAIKSESKIIFFLHLLGMDTAGHVHKPGSVLFLENLKVTDNGISEIYKLFERLFDDKKTAYVLTSDHGMTNTGSHGAGDTYETDTPLVVWGAGVNNWSKLKSESLSGHSTRIDEKNVPLFDVEQADIAPLIASLIGTAVPVNNYGKLPKNYLNVSDEYKAQAMYNNALQTLTQYKKLLNEFKEGWFSNIMPSFKKLDTIDVNHLKSSIEQNIYSGNYASAIEKSEQLVDDALEGTEYYQTYYQPFLLFCTAMSFLGWICHLLIMLENQATRKTFSSVAVYIFSGFLAILFGLFIYLQGISQTVGIYFILPIICWMRSLQKINFHHMLRTLKDNWTIFTGMLIGTELMVLSFFKRETISIALLAFTLYQNRTFKIVRSNETQKHQYYQWLISALLLIVFPAIPLGYIKQNDFLLTFGGLLWMTKLCTSVKDMKNSKLMQLFCFTGFTNCLVCLFSQKSANGLLTISLLMTWLLSGLSCIAPVFSDPNLKNRVISIFIYFGIPYFHLSVSYEMLFFTLLGINALSFVELNEIVDNQFIPKTISARKSERNNNLAENLNISSAMLLLIFLSFFGTGNIASISSFDPTVVRFFVTTFSPFTMTALIILKLVIPVVLITSAISGLAFRKKIDEKKVLLSLLLICEMMGLNFLFMVTNQGSWLEIGSSISHFVIMEVTILVLALVNNVSKLLIFVDLSKKIKLKTGKLK